MDKLFICNGKSHDTVYLNTRLIFVQAKNKLLILREIDSSQTKVKLGKTSM